MARISTGTGDDGTTGLVGGARVPKSHARIRTVGAIDEANDQLGIAITHATRPGLVTLLRSIQEDLFTVGADVAAPEGVRTTRVTPAHVDRIVVEEDRLEGTLPPLTRFILPGGTPCAAHLQLARSIVRRAEREAWAAHAQEPLNIQAIIYLNRLSDLLFLLAREENIEAGKEETQWVGLKRG